MGIKKKFDIKFRRTRCIAFACRDFVMNSSKKWQNENEKLIFTASFYYCRTKYEMKLLFFSLHHQPNTANTCALCPRTICGRMQTMLVEK